MYRIGETSYSLEDYKQAETEFLAFLERFPNHELNEWALPYLADAQLRLDKTSEAAKHFRSTHDVIDVDGVRVLFGDGWGLIRASNTQPVLVLRFEARSEERLRAIRDEMEGWLRSRNVRI